jgi:hypothetical protein
MFLAFIDGNSSGTNFVSMMTRWVMLAATRLDYTVVNSCERLSGTYGRTLWLGRRLVGPATASFTPRIFAAIMSASILQIDTLASK